MSSFCAGIICACVSWVNPPPVGIIGPTTVGIASSEADLAAALDWRDRWNRANPDRAEIIHHIGECHGEPVS